MAGTQVVAHWDDDDLYLPWHLSMCVSTLLEGCGIVTWACAKPGAAWWVTGPREGPFDNRGIHHNVFEGQMVFDRDRALELGGYPPLDSGQAKALLDAFKRAGELHTWNPPDEQVSYVYRWGDGADHVSARLRPPCRDYGGQARTRPPCRDYGGQAPGGPSQDADFGDGGPLIPAGDPLTWARARLSGQFGGLLMGFRRRLSERLLAAVRPGSAAGATRGQPDGKRAAASDAGPR
jgi:hypothetical protein